MTDTEHEYYRTKEEWSSKTDFASTKTGSLAHNTEELAYFIADYDIAPEEAREKLREAHQLLTEASGLLGDEALRLYEDHQ